MWHRQPKLIILLLTLILLVSQSAQAQDEPSPYDIALQRIEELKFQGGGTYRTGIVLSLSGLGLTELPPEIGEFTELIELWIDDNQLQSLPPEIARLEILRVLSVNNNQLTSLPPEISTLSNLCYLDVQNNQLRNLPPRLGTLRFPGNYCPFTPPFQEIYVSGNPLVSPPPEVVEQGTSAILDYLREQYEQQQMEKQRLIIGTAGGVGLLALLILSFRFKQRGARKEKPKRDAA